MSLKGETYEKDTMYPEFIKKAQDDGNAKAVRTFTFAKDVEANHAKLYQATLDNPEAWKVAGVFYDCGECGNTVEKIDFQKCPVCGEPKSRYFKVS